MGKLRLREVEDLGQDHTVKPSGFLALLLQDVLCIGWMRVSLAVLDIHS